MADDFKYHIDHHGSLVRPPALLAARAAGLSGEALAATEEDAVEAAAHLQRRLVLSTVGDGQFRREHFESVVYDHVSCFVPVIGPTPLAELAGIPYARRQAIAGRPGGPGSLAVVGADGRLAQAEVAPVIAVVDRPVFVALPSPGYLAAVGSALDGPAAVDAIRAAGRRWPRSCARRSRRWRPTGSPTSPSATRSTRSCSRSRAASGCWRCCRPTSGPTRCWPR